MQDIRRTILVNRDTVHSGNALSGFVTGRGSGPDSRAVVPTLLQQSFIPNQGRFAVYSNNTVCASFVDGVLLYMIWNFANFNINEECPDNTTFQKSSSTVGYEQFGWCCLRYPDGSSKLVEMDNPGEYARYIKTAVSWCRWLDEKELGELVTPVTKDTDMVQGLGMVACELEKIQRFNCILKGNLPGRFGTPIHPQFFWRTAVRIVAEKVMQQPPWRVIRTALYRMESGR
ncbi:hypothetical protein GDO81_002768 [Engystomops pustulosus]|uniref:C5orf34-like C-terminal domain-containing protein n=1 Tax=Engystomops pustulosus TaxID=76066 RepID=A0AAV7DRJ0_ENGPU|nr:hypothetical protein GDO81_002768 [Engystomops pustulosus]